MRDADATVEAEIRERLEQLVDDHDLPTVFWSLDAVYDEFDQRMVDHSLTEVPIFQAKVKVPDHKATSGERYEKRRIEGVLDRDEAEDRLDDDPEVRSVESLEQVGTKEVFF